MSGNMDMRHPNDATRTGQAVTNLAIFGLYRQGQVSNAMQLEQLNLLRKHQGLPPLTMQDMQPPPLFGKTVGAIVDVICTLGLIGCALFAIGVVVFYLVVIPLMLIFGAD